MKKYVNGLIVLLFLIGVIAVLTLENNRLSKDLNTATINNKAFAAENSSLKESNNAFKLTIEQLESLNDSISFKINNIKKELNIRNKDIQQLQYIASEAKKIDTIVFRDTLFVDNVSIDTVIGDYWYTMKLGLRYPGTVITEPTFQSEKYVIMNYRKETVNPPKKCFISRMFQKKHKVLEVHVIENNPYIENKQQRFIEIIK